MTTSTLKYLALRFNFVITYRPGSQQIRFDALPRRAYLAPKEGDVAYEEQKTNLIKPEQLQLKTVRTIVLVDISFFQDIRVSLQSDLLALKLKNNLSISGFEEIPSLDSQVSDSEVIDSEYPNQPTSSSQVSRLRETLRDDDSRLQFKIQDYNSEMGYYTTRDYFMSLKAHADSECSSLATTSHRWNTLVTTKSWS